MHPVSIRITVDLGYDEAVFTAQPIIQRISEIPAEVAEVQLDRAVADAKTWIATRARGAEV
jgi:hypothetical protein